MAESTAQSSYSKMKTNMLSECSGQILNAELAKKEFSPAVSASSAFGGLKFEERREHPRSLLTIR
jgi:hypothetical protein